MRLAWLCISTWIITLLAATAFADLSFTLNKDAAMMLTATGNSPTDFIAPTQLFGVTDDPSLYNSTGAMRGQAGYIGLLNDRKDGLDDPFAWIRIGAGSAVGNVIGTALGTAPITDLRGFTDYRLFLANDDDDIWQVKLYMSTSGVLHETAWETLTPGTSDTLMLSFAGIANLNNVTDIGFVVGGRLNQIGGNPSDPDVFHISAVPNPAGLVLALLGLAVGGLELYRYDRCTVVKRQLT